ncbi:MAG: hypothetical protein KGN02_02925 [bacterium]|nr:hypothetical protein [bacterium]
MEALIEIHLVVAFLLALCALVFSWNTMGRRVVNAVAVLQFVVGLAIAGMLGKAAPSQVWVHLIVALLILGAYGMAMAAGKREGGSSRALIFSIVGFILVFANIWLGWAMAHPGAGV